MMLGDICRALTMALYFTPMNILIMVRCHLLSGSLPCMILLSCYVKLVG